MPSFQQIAHGSELQPFGIALLKGQGFTSSACWVPLVLKATGASQ